MEKLGKHLKHEINRKWILFAKIEEAFIKILNIIILFLSTIGFVCGIVMFRFTYKITDLALALAMILCIAVNIDLLQGLTKN